MTHGPAPRHLYVLGLGSNRAHGRHGRPAAILAAAKRALAEAGICPLAVAPTLTSLPLGPGGRAYANSAVLVESALAPPELLTALKRIERAFGRRAGRRWGARVIDIDVLLWSGGRWHEPQLTIPHRELSRRRFVLDPLAAIAPGWRVPGGGTVRQLRARLTRRRPIHRSNSRSGP